MKYKIVFCLTLIFPMLVACSFSLAADVTPPPGYTPPPQQAQSQPSPVSAQAFPFVPPNPADGAPIYVEKCAPCHGTSGMGDGPRAAQLPNPVSALGTPEIARQAKPSEWYRLVSEGNLERFMPPFPSLNDRQRWDVLAYVFNLSITEEQLAMGESLYRENCMACHGEYGRGDGLDAAGLSTKPRSFSDLEYMATRSTGDYYQAISDGVSPDMPAYVNQLSEAERWALSDYIRSLTFPITPRDQQASAQATPSFAETPAPAITATQPVSYTEAIGNISGKLVNQSGGPLPVGATIVLSGVDHSSQLVYSQTVPLDSDGSYEFIDVPMPSGRVYVVTLDHDGVTYWSEVATIGEQPSDLNLPLSIFDSTSDLSSLTIDRLHLFFDFVDEKTLRVVELYVISNNGNKAVVAPAEGQPVISFAIPEGASNLEFQDGMLGERYLTTAGGFGDTVPIRPGSGEHQVLFTYTMPYSRKLELSQNLPLATNAVVIFVPDQSINIKGDKLEDGGKQDVEGITYRIYNRAELDAGELFRLEISGKPVLQLASRSDSTNTGIIIGLVALGLALIIGGIWMYRRNKVQSEVFSAEEEVISPASTADENADSLIDAIMALDDLFKDGQLPEAAYRQRRAELKQRLAKATG